MKTLGNADQPDFFWKYMSFSGKTDMWERSWKYHPDMLLMES